ncbi:MAG: Xaa-Pro peptidase family protein [Ferruginibacter sp.]
MSTNKKINRFEKLQLLAESSGVDGFLFTSPASIKCFSGYYFNFETGPSPFQLLPAALFISLQGKRSLLLADSETDKGNLLQGDVELSFYDSYVYENPLHFEEDFLLKLTTIIGSHRYPKAMIGIEKNSFPFSLYEAINNQFPTIKLSDITASLSYLKAIKDEDEIELIRQAAHLADIGQAAVLKYAAEGITELGLFSKVRLEMEMAAGTRVPMMTDLVSGAETASGGRNPGYRIIQKNDLILSDFTPCLNGYWGDSCNTMIVGTPTDQQQKVFTLVKGALETGIAAIRPGVEARSVDLAMRKHLAEEGNFGHHGGHGVGTVYHEEPRIVPYNTMILEPGMVIALEPAIYKNDWGIRLEHLVAVTEQGCDVITKFQHSFEQ